LPNIPSIWKRYAKSTPIIPLDAGLFINAFNKKKGVKTPLGLLKDLIYKLPKPRGAQRVASEPITGTTPVVFALETLFLTIGVSCSPRAAHKVD